MLLNKLQTAYAYRYIPDVSNKSFGISIFFLGFFSFLSCLSKINGFMSLTAIE